MKPNRIVLFYLFISFFFTRLSFSQTGSEPTPVFIIEGVVKLKNRPTDNATLTLYKDGKQIARLITPKNGLYRFELAKSNTNPKNIYKIDVTKESTTNVLLNVNTYIPQDQYNPLPYLFNYDFNLTSVETMGQSRKKDLGNVKWDTEKRIFAFDGNYVSTIEQEEKTADSLKAAEAKAELVKKQEEKKQADSLMSSILKKNDPPNPNQTEEQNKSTSNKSITSSKSKNNTTKNSSEKNNSSSSNIEKTGINSDSENNKTTNKTEENNTNSTASKSTNKNNATRSNSAKNAKTEHIQNNSKNGVALETSTKNQNGQSNPLTNNNNSKANTTAEKSKTNETTALNNSSRPNNTNNYSTSNKGGTNTTGNNILKNTENTGNIADTAATNGNTANAGPKDLFFLTGVPMEQFKRDLGTVNNGKNEDFYDEKEQLFSNSERSRLLSEKLKMQRKKAENFAKKHETNNTLTSLLDEVVEFEKSNRHQNNVNTK